MTQPAPTIWSVGLVCPIGATWEQSCKAYEKGERGFKKERDLVAPDGRPPVLASVLSLKDCRCFDQRLLELFSRALQDLLDTSGAFSRPIPLILVVQPWFAKSDRSANLIQSLRERYPRHLESISIVGGGSAAGVGELGHAAATLVERATKAILVGAVDSYVEPTTLDALYKQGRAFWGRNPHGFIPGEAACVFLVVQADGDPPFSAAAPPLGCISSVCQSIEDENVLAPSGILGRGLASARSKAAAIAMPDRLLVDLNGERWRSEELGFALARAGDGLEPLISDPETPALNLGDCGVGMGCVLAALALSSRSPAGPAARINWALASSLSGERAVAIIEREERDNG